MTPLSDQSLTTVAQSWEIEEHQHALSISSRRCSGYKSSSGSVAMLLNCKRMGAKHSVEQSISWFETAQHGSSSHKCPTPPPASHTWELNMRRISEDSLFTIVFSLVSHRTGTVYLPG